MSSHETTSQQQQQQQQTPPVQPTPTAASASTGSNGASTNSSNGSAPPSSVNELPSEALALAAKLFDMARSGDSATLLRYIDAGIQPNLTNHSGDTLLMLASYHNHPDLVSSLLSKGSDPNALNDKGQSPLAGAVFKGYDEVVKVLVEQGRADIRAGQPNAVECAAMFRRWDSAKVMQVEEEVRRLAPQLNPVGSRDELMTSSTNATASQA